MSANGNKIPSNILVGTWGLSKTESAVQEEMVLEDQGKVTGQAESIIGEDKRKLVPADDFKTGGKYRAIVKLQMRYEDQGDEDNRWAMGSGSLIRHDIVVTAGHCVYDWANGMGRAVRINAYIGYNGRDSVKNKDADVQLRRGLRVATTAGWLASSSNRTSDVAFIKLDSGFTGITSQLVHHMPTPVKGAEILGIVGYPGDKFKKDKNGKEEKGAQMYEAWEHTEWNLETSTKNMLSYTISTAGGQSGSAVLRASSTYRTSIGAHTYGGSYSNSASPIAGQYGNVYSAYVSVVDDPKPVVVTTKKNVNYVSVSALDSQEGFLDTGRDIAKIASNIASTVLTTGSPFLGPVVGPLAAVAGAALGYVGSLCESTMGNDTTAESAIESIEQNPIMHRAILGEAVLQSLGSIRDESRLNAIYSRMDAYYQRNAPGIFKIGPTVLSALGADSQAGAGELTDKGEKKKIEYTMTESESLKGSRKAFLKKLLEDSPQVGESFFNGELGNILVGGIQCPDTIAQHSRTGLCYLGSIVAPTHMGVDLDDMDEAQQLLLRRSVLSQAALDAVIHENKKKIDGQAVPLPEGFFQKAKQVVQVIAPHVLNTLPKLIQDVTPAITKLIQNGAAAEATADSSSDSSDEDTSDEDTSDEDTHDTAKPDSKAKRYKNKSRGKKHLPKRAIRALAGVGPTSYDDWAHFTPGQHLYAQDDAEDSDDMEVNQDGIDWEKP